MSGMKPYIVRQGDYLAKIAFTEGFDADEVWRDDKNGELVKLRKDPSILAPGDVLYVPNTSRAKEDITVDNANEYRAKVPDVELNVQFFNDEGKPLKDERCEISVSGSDAAIFKKTGPDGYLRLKIPTTCIFVDVTIEALGCIHRIQVGWLNPADTSGGETDRLSNLGLFGSMLQGSQEFADMKETFHEDDIARLRRQARQRINEASSDSPDSLHHLHKR